VLRHLPQPAARNIQKVSRDPVLEAIHSRILFCLAITAKPVRTLTG
jgi:hypothetical protein